MKKTVIYALLAIVFMACNKTQQYALDSVLPIPLQTTAGKGSFTTDKGVAVESSSLHLIKALERGGIAIDTASERKISLICRDNVEGITSPEGYRIEITPKHIAIEATAECGLFYGIQTISQLNNIHGNIPCGTITDEPRFPYRGLMLDVSRHFFDKDFIKKQIDAISHYKMNRLHLHLTDAAGWRVEIKKYPRLTQFAAWRSQELWKDWWYGDRLYKEEGSPDAHGGYFTQEDIRELVAYAAERHITIIPEIEMPAHSEEVLTAYPHLSCTHVPYKQADFCVGNEATFEFIEDVLTEILELFPSEYIHIGGDEAGKASWGTCPLCNKRMKEEGLKNLDELQSYLIERVEKFLNSKGRNIIGWDEIIEGGIAPNATIMSWRGTDGGIKAVRNGHKAIMTPGEYCYLDSYQDAPHTQPVAFGGYLPLEKVYSYNPAPDSLTSEEAKLIYGIQGNVWAEYIPTEEQSEHMIYPRILAIAETGWSPQNRRNYEDFHKRALTAVKQLRENDYSSFDLGNEYGNRPQSLTTNNHLAKGKKVHYAQGSPYYPTYTAGGDSALTDGIHGGWNNSDKRWQGFIGRGGIDVCIDLENITDITSVSADFMQLCEPGIYLPATVEITVSADSSTFTNLATIEHNVVRDDTLSFKNYGWQGTAKARYIRYRATRGKQGGFMFTDEIVVE